MPDGLTHYRYYKMGWAVSLPISIYFMVSNPPVGIGILTGYLLGRWIDPDLDQIGITNSEGRIVNEFKIVGTVIVGYTTIYGSIFRRLHRSLITHLPILSTTIRLVYFFWWLYFVIDILYDWQIWFGIGALVGLSFADLIHFILDMMFPDIGKLSPKSNTNKKRMR